MSSGERRKAKRSRTVLLAIGCSLDETTTFDCHIRNQTADSAHIKFSESVPVPLSFYLINVRDRVAYEAKVKWRKPGESGLELGPAIALVAPEPRYRHLRRLCFQKALK